MPELYDISLSARMFAQVMVAIILRQVDAKTVEDAQYILDDHGYECIRMAQGATACQNFPALNELVYHQLGVDIQTKEGKS